MRTLHRFTLSALLLLMIVMLSVFAVSAQTGVNEEEELDCPAFEGSSVEIRTGYYMGEAAAFMLSRQYASAIYSYSCILQQVDTEYIPALLNRAVAHTQRRSLDLAIEDYDAVLALDPNFVPAINNRGIVQAARFEYEEALADFTAAIDASPTYTRAYINRAVIYAIGGQYNLAVADLQTAISTTNLEQVLELINRVDDPNTAVDESDVEIPPYNPDLAVAYALLGMIEAQQALDQYNDYLDLTGSRADSRIQSAASALDSRARFEMRFDDGSWMRPAIFSLNGSN